MDNIFNKDIKPSEGYIDKQNILSKTSEGEIFSLIFDRIPEEGDYVNSPLREDRNPGCYFITNTNGELTFVDFGSTYMRNNKTWVYFDCFDLVQAYFNLNSFYSTLKFINEKLSLKDREKIVKKPTKEKKTRQKYRILLEPRNYLLVDKEYWYDKYGITKENLIEDKVIPLNRFKMFTPEKSFTITSRKITYAYTDFESRNVKVYRPRNRVKFYTNCRTDDIGALRLLNYQREDITITSSYKDYRVLKNLGLNPIWMPSETTIADMKVLLPLLNKFSRVNIFYDNDEVGIKAAENLKTIILSYLNIEVFIFIVPLGIQGVTDPSDFIEKVGRNTFTNFLLERRILIY